MFGVDRARFCARVDERGPDECWPWTGAIQSQGYGSVRGVIGGRRRSVLAHRVAFAFASGREFPSTVHVCHRCDNPQCCNPRHLFPGDPAINAADKMAKGRARGARGEAHRDARLTVADVVAIREAVRRGEMQSTLAVRYQVSRATIWQIVHRRHWAHVPDAFDLAPEAA